jgi:glycosyltransferase involved in cell wall biosynthesis
MMTIVYISSEYPPETGNGGIGTYTKHIAEGMSSIGHSVHVIARSTSEERYEQKINGVTVHRVPPEPFVLPQSRMFYYLRVMLRGLFYHTLVRLSWASAAAKELKLLDNNLTRIDIIEYPECGAEGFFIKTNPETLKVVRLHTPWFFVRKINTIRECIGDQWFFKYLEIHSIRKADLITAPTKAVVSIFKGIKTKRSPFIIPNPVNIQQKVISSGNKWIYTGRVERRKGVHILIEAYLDVCEKHQPPELILIGAPFGVDGDGTAYEKKIEALISHSRHSHNIVWTKGVSHDKVYEYLCQSAVAFFPSLWENFAYSCLEAMAVGCTVVASDCGGFPEMISNGVNGFLIKPEDKSSWSEIMVFLLNNPEMSNNISKSAIEHINNKYNSDQVCLKTEQYLSEQITKLKNGK